MNSGKLNSLLVMLLGVSFLLQGCSSNTTVSGVSAKGDERRAVLDQESAKDQNEAVPEDVPRVSEFILGPGDELEIDVYRRDDLRRVVRIGPSGRIMYPMTGDVQAAGLSIFQLRDKIHDGLSKYIVDPQVFVSIVSVRSQKIIVLGEVNNPGFFQPDISMAVLEAVSRAGGFTRDSELKSVVLIRGGMEKPELRALNLRKALKSGDLGDNVLLQSGDIIYVPNTFISDVSRFFSHFSAIISPIVEAERAYLLGDEIMSGGGESVRVR